MDLFKQVKAAVPAIQAARDYGMEVSRSGMALCPFHDDHHPSLQLGDRYYCHACGASGDVIDLTSHLLGVDGYSAAKQLALDYGIHTTQELDSCIHCQKDCKQSFRAVIVRCPRFEPVSTTKRRGAVLR